MRKLIFEGAGWPNASGSGDVGNCRIRTRIKNALGKLIYLEMSVGQHGGFVWHCFENNCNEKSQWRELENKTFIWDKRSILVFVNKNLNCFFDSLEVDGNPDVHSTTLPLCESPMT